MSFVDSSNSDSLESAKEKLINFMVNNPEANNFDEFVEGLNKEEQEFVLSIKELDKDASKNLREEVRKREIELLKKQVELATGKKTKNIGLQRLAGIIATAQTLSPANIMQAGKKRLGEIVDSPTFEKHYDDRVNVGFSPEQTVDDLANNMEQISQEETRRSTRLQDITQINEDILIPNVEELEILQHLLLKTLDDALKEYCFRAPKKWGLMVGVPHDLTKSFLFAATALEADKKMSSRNDELGQEFTYRGFHVFIASEKFGDEIRITFAKNKELKRIIELNRVMMSSLG